MSIQRNSITTQTFSFTPTTLKEAQEYATIFANSGLCPAAYKGRPNDILIVWQMGKELGLDKMQAIRTLGCINGMPFAYGDGLLALVKRHPQFGDMKEWFEGDLKDGTLTAYCMMTRKGNEPVTQKFSMEDAQLAGLWRKVGPWTQYPRRMLQHRARGFAAKDAFPDALFGLMSEQEVRDIQTEKAVIISENKGLKGLKETLQVSEEVTEVTEGNFEVITNSENENLIEEMLTLISEKNISEATQEKWKKKFNVSVINDIPVEGIKKIINHIKEKMQ